MAASATGRMCLRGKAALITGGAGGLGKAFGQRILQAGGMVNLVDYDAKRGQASAAEFQEEFGTDRAVFTQCDVTNMTQLENAFDATATAFGRLDIVCNNAGVAPVMFQDADKTVAINLTAVIHGTRLAWEHMSASGSGGVVINTASMAGIVPVPLTPVYAATKSGVVNLSRSCAVTFRKQGVRVNALCPAFTDTAMVSEHIGNKHFKKVVDGAGGVMKVDTVADAFMQLVTEERHWGSVMMVTPHTGIMLKSSGEDTMAQLSKL